MRSNDMSRLDNPDDSPISAPTDWAAVDALTEEELHAAAMADPDAHPLSRTTDTGLKHLVNVKSR